MRKLTDEEEKHISEQFPALYGIMKCLRDGTPKEKQAMKDALAPRIRSWAEALSE